MKTNFKNKLHDLLKKDSRLWDEEKKELNETRLKDLIDKLDEKLIELLLSDKETNKKFFAKVKDVYVLKQNELKFFIDENKLDNSYTQYQNKIGLRIGCVLEGGMTKEDQKRNEIFFNEILAKDEIDRLFDEKALVNWKKYTKDGEQEVKEIKRDRDGTIQENLIIKGNNLLALQSIKKQFAGKVKLIYIDPPYNTGGDAETFTYNNNFKHSTWLTFMKNRLMVGKNLLREDGFIAIAIDHFELGYLIPLGDEILGRENRIGIISIVNNPMGRNQAKYFSTINDFMIVYAKKIELAEFNSVVLNPEFYKTFDREDKKGKYKLKSFVRIGGGDANLRVNKSNFWYPIYASHDLKEITLEKKKNYFEIFPITPTGQERTWKLSKNSTEILLNELVAIKNGNDITIYEKYRIEKGQKVPTVWSDKRYNANHNGIRLLEKIIGRKDFSFPKSLYTVLDTIKLMTKPDDLILDFHAGSGTTAHAVLRVNKEDKGNRKFILIEQLNEHIEICKERNQKVLAQENIDDNFIYFELAKWNEEAKEKILKAKSLTELEKLFAELYKRYFLNYNVKTKEFKEKILKEEGFKSLSLDEQKNLFVEMLDINQMYVNFSERADKKYNLSKEDIDLSEIFYNSRR